MSYTDTIRYARIEAAGAVLTEGTDPTPDPEVVAWIALEDPWV